MSFHSRRDWVLTGLLLTGVGFAYSPSLFCGFIWDDDVGIIQNENLRSLEGLGRIWTDPTRTPQGHYWPVVYTTFWLEHQFWGLNPFGYHLTNLLFQAINTWLLWRLLQRLGLPGAWFAAALFGIHPIQTESVAWVIERKNLLSGFFSILSVWNFLTYQEKHSPKAYLMSLSLFVFGMLSKSSVFALPFVLAVLIYWRSSPSAPIKKALPVVPFLVLGSLIATWDVSLVQQREVIDHGLAWRDRLVVAGRSFWFYLFKILIPAKMVAVYPKWEIERFSIGSLGWPLSVLAVGGILYDRCRRFENRGLWTAFLVYSLFLAPTLGFVDFGFMSLSFVADRFAYLATIPVFCVAAAGGQRLLERSRRTVFWKSLFIFTLIVSALLTAKQCTVYRGQETLVRHNLRLYPQAWIVRYNFAIDLATLGRVEESVEEYRRVIEDRPQFLEARNNLGTLYVRMGRFREAEAQFKAILKTDPDNARAYQNLGVLAQRQGDLPSALVWYRRSLSLNPENPALRQAIERISSRIQEKDSGN